MSTIGHKRKINDELEALRSKFQMTEKDEKQKSIWPLYEHILRHDDADMLKAQMLENGKGAAVAHVELIRLANSFSAFNCMTVLFETAPNFPMFVRDVCLQSPPPIFVLHHILHWCGFQVRPASASASASVSALASLSSVSFATMKPDETKETKEKVDEKKPFSKADEKKPFSKADEKKPFSKADEKKPFSKADEKKPFSISEKTLAAMTRLGAIISPDNLVIPQGPPLTDVAARAKWRVMACMVAIVSWIQYTKRPATDQWMQHVRNVFDALHTCLVTRDANAVSLLQPYWISEYEPFSFLTEPLTWRLLMNPAGPFAIRVPKHFFDLSAPREDMTRCVLVAMESFRLYYDDDQECNSLLARCLEPPTHAIDNLFLRVLSRLQEKNVWCSNVEIFEYLTARPELIRRLLRQRSGFVLVNDPPKTLTDAALENYHRTFLNVLAQFVAIRRELLDPKIPANGPKLMQQAAASVQFLSTRSENRHYQVVAREILKGAISGSYPVLQTQCDQCTTPGGLNATHVLCDGSFSECVTKTKLDQFKSDPIKKGFGEELVIGVVQTSGQSSFENKQEKAPLSQVPLKSALKQHIVTGASDRVDPKYMATQQAKRIKMETLSDSKDSDSGSDSGSESESESGTDDDSASESESASDASESGTDDDDESGSESASSSESDSESNSDSESESNSDSERASESGSSSGSNSESGSESGSESDK